MENGKFTIAPPPQPLRQQRKISYPSLAKSADQVVNEKAQSLADNNLSPAQSSAQWTPYAYADSEPDTARLSFPATTTTPSSQFLRHPSSHHPHRRSLTHSSRGRGSVLAVVLRPWIPLILYAISSLAFVVAIAFYKTELFEYLDELSLWLRADEQYGHAVLFCLIFLTTIPPFPLYSTLIVLSGYTFGAWTGAVISYFAALSGALVVFVVSRALLRESIERWLQSCAAIKRVIRAIEKRPKLLFLIRLAPYPYNVMNCLLAASPTLTLHTYTVCTALSLFKVIIHTSIGASIQSFRDYHSSEPTPSDEESSGTDIMAHVWTIVGILLCVLILVYLSVVARRAVDDELEDELPITARDTEETRAFLSACESDIESAHPTRANGMTESPFREQQPFTPYRSADPDSSWR